jgi:hypothetical protein
MSAVAELLAEAKTAGVKFHVKGPGNIAMSAPRAPPPELMARIKAAKPALLVMLGAVAVEIPADWTAGVARMRVMPCPTAVPPVQWGEMVTDAEHFLTSQWASTSAALGWDTPSLFGCHRDRPLQRLDCQGVVWLFGAAAIVAVTDSAIIIRGGGGTTLTCCRPKASKSDLIILAWELAP